MAILAIPVWKQNNQLPHDFVGKGMLNVLGYALTDRHKMWHGYAYWPSEQVRHLKFANCTNQRWRTAEILKKSKDGHISQHLA